MRKLLLRILLTGILVGLFQLITIFSESDAAAPSETIRVAIVKNASAVTVSGDGVIATRENGSAVAVNAPVTVRSGRDGVILDGTSYRRLTFAGASAIQINGKPYRGVAELSMSDKGIVVVNELLLEEYLVGLINCEISSAWPIEAVKAQAVIARTYALHRRDARKSSLYHLESSVMDQVYEGCEIEDSRAHRAVSETAGEVLVYNGSIIQAFYHSNCGGKTEAAENVWGARLPYMMGVDCLYCLTNPTTAWEQKVSLQEMEDKLRAAGHRVAGVSDIRPGVRNSRGRLKNIMISSSRGETVLGGDQFRKVIGYGVIKSTNFTVTVKNGEAQFAGFGNGHGVGLCQWGSKQRALDGFLYTEILSYYYPGTELKKLLEDR